jgi:hypothetical protein
MAACYRECIAPTVHHNIQTLALSCISTGSYQLPWRVASEIDGGSNATAIVRAQRPTKLAPTTMRNPITPNTSAKPSSVSWARSESRKRFLNQIDMVSLLEA